MTEANKEAMELVDAILKASGSALHHYSMHQTRSNMFAAAQAHLGKARNAALEEAKAACKAALRVDVPDDEYSSGMENGAELQVEACIDAIDALKTN